MASRGTPCLRLLLWVRARSPAFAVWVKSCLWILKEMVLGLEEVLNVSVFFSPSPGPTFSFLFSMGGIWRSPWTQWERESVFSWVIWKSWLRIGERKEDVDGTRRELGNSYIFYGWRVSKLVFFCFCALLFCFWTCDLIILVCNIVFREWKMPHYFLVPQHPALLGVSNNRFSWLDLSLLC